MKKNIYSETRDHNLQTEKAGKCHKGYKVQKNTLLVSVNCLHSPVILSTDWLLTLYISNLIFPLPPMYL